MAIPRRIWILAVVAVFVAAACVRLGFWQIDRLHQRRARNEVVATRLATAPVALDALPRDTASSHYRRVAVAGVPDHAQTFVVGPRTRLGSPGVHVVVPVRMPGSDTAVLVNRGWSYSPDGVTIPPNLGPETDTTFVGYVEEFTSGGTDAELPSRTRALRRMQMEAVARLVPYPVHPFYIVATGPSPSDDAVSGQPVLRIGDPVIDEGPHKGYAFQWFAFATIAIGGAGLVMVRSRREPSARTMQEQPNEVRP
jgi:surfeit locus 1 family protein